MTDKQWPSAEELIQMAQNNPEELERFKEREINALIESAPTSMRRRLRGLQFQIDCKRQMHSNPLSSCIAISKMMLESLNDLNDALHGDYENNSVAKATKANRKPRKNSNSQVIPFPSAVI